MIAALVLGVVLAIAVPAPTCFAHEPFTKEQVNQAKKKLASGSYERDIGLATVKKLSTFIIYLPNYYLLRGRDRLVVGDMAGALADVEQGERAIPPELKPSEGFVEGRNYSNLNYKLAFAVLRAEIHERQGAGPETLIDEYNVIYRQFDTLGQHQDEFRKVTSKLAALHNQVFQAEFSAAVAAAPQLKPYNDEGFANYQAKNYPAAIAAQTKAIEQKPDFYQSWVLRGVFRMDSGDLNGALEDFAHADSLAHTSRDGWLERSRGNAYYRSGDYANALKAYDKAIAIQPEEAINRTYRDNTLGQIEKNAHPDAWAKYQLCLQSPAGSPQAMAAISDAIAINPNFALYYIWRVRVRASALQNGANPPEARLMIADAKTALRLDPKSIETWYAMGLANGMAGWSLKNNDPNQSPYPEPFLARQYYGAALALNPSDKRLVSVNTEIAAFIARGAPEIQEMRAYQAVQDRAARAAEAQRIEEQNAALEARGRAAGNGPESDDVYCARPANQWPTLSSCIERRQRERAERARRNGGY